ncbi:tyrosine-type recombinase/integrase [Ferrimonas kyonanensis]|uniref:tyrosine-type recombinase/integrase n=1 Tax=Ferrimonas kyonanensis TaxID=364763 RepID=UPI00040E8214|nr:tyrosine-type recombinase/integrase [Ferrimonas kyonanensis]
MIPVPSGPALAALPSPVQLDWPAMAAVRRRVLHHVEMPAYLLLPEVSALLDALDDDRQRLLLDLLWNTGARITEALALTPADLALDDPHQPYVSLPTLKQRPRSARRPKPRLVPLLDPAFVVRLRRYLATHRPPKRERLWQVSDQTVRNWMGRAYERASAAGAEIAFRPGPHSLRHSFAVHCVLHQVPVPVLQAWMGHRSRRSTEIYTQVMGIEAFGLGQQVAFSLPLTVAR